MSSKAPGWLARQAATSARSSRSASGASAEVVIGSGAPTRPRKRAGSSPLKVRRDEGGSVHVSDDAIWGASSRLDRSVRRRLHLGAREHELIDFRDRGKAPARPERPA